MEQVMKETFDYYNYLMINFNNYIHNCSNNIVTYVNIQDKYSFISILISFINATIVGVLTIFIVYVIIPSISTLIVLTLGVFIMEFCNKIKNTYLLITNLMNGIINDINVFIDGCIVTLMFLVCFYSLLFKT